MWICYSEEFAITDDDDRIIGCQFGQTAEGIGSSERCEEPCEGNADFNCVCVSSSDAEDGLVVDAQFKLLLGVTMTILVVVLCAVQCVRRRIFAKKMTKFLAELEAKGGDPNKVGIVAPQPPAEWFCYVLYLVLLILLILFFVQSADIRNSDFWAGCGSQENLS